MSQYQTEALTGEFDVVFIGSDCLAVHCAITDHIIVILLIQGDSVNSTADNSKTCLTHTKFHGPCQGNDNLLGISRTFGHYLN